MAFVLTTHVSLVSKRGSGHHVSNRARLTPTDEHVHLVSTRISY